MQSLRQIHQKSAEKIVTLAVRGSPAPQRGAQTKPLKRQPLATDEAQMNHGWEPKKGFTQTRLCSAVGAT